MVWTIAAGRYFAADERAQTRASEARLVSVKKNAIIPRAAFVTIVVAAQDVFAFHPVVLVLECDVDTSKSFNLSNNSMEYQFKRKLNSPQSDPLQSNIPPGTDHVENHAAVDRISDMPDRHPHGDPGSCDGPRFAELSQKSIGYHNLPVVTWISECGDPIVVYIDHSLC
jgi:hypothetical protein